MKVNGGAMHGATTLGITVSAAKGILGRPSKPTMIKNQANMLTETLFGDRALTKYEKTHFHLEARGINVKLMQLFSKKSENALVLVDY